MGLVLEWDTDLRDLRRGERDRMIITTMAEVTPDLQRIPDIEKISDATFWTLGFCDKDLDRISGLFRHRTGNLHSILSFLIVLALHLKNFLGNKTFFALKSE